MKTKQHRTHKIRLYPNAQQRAKLLRVEELTRVVYNWAVLLIYNWYEDLDAHIRFSPSLIAAMKDGSFTLAGIS